MPRLQRIIAVPDIDWSKYRFLPESRLAQQTAALNELTRQFINQTKKSTYCVNYYSIIINIFVLMGVNLIEYTGYDNDTRIYIKPFHP